LWWYISVIPALLRQRQEDGKFEASSGYISQYEVHIETLSQKTKGWQCSSVTVPMYKALGSSPSTTKTKQTKMSDRPPLRILNLKSMRKKKNS
jgi:hypothetical protein